MKIKLELGFGLALCVTSGEGFKKGVIYPIVGWNNGINIARTDENGDVLIFLACNGGVGEGDLNNFDNSGSPSFREIKEAQNYAGDNNNSDNMYNIGDDLMDQQREAEE